MTATAAVARPTRCIVCERPLTRRGGGVTGLCRPCMQAGAEFARAWAEDLRTQNLTYPQVAEIIGTSEDAIRVRLAGRQRARARS